MCNETSKSNQRLRGDEGVTLIELLVVLLIIGLLTAVVAPRIFGAAEGARETKARTDIANLEAALERYRLQLFTYPTTEQGLDALVVAPDGLGQPELYPDEGFIKRLPEDPWGNPYQYENPGQFGAIDIYSYGADGQPGGEDLNADIGNWQ